MTVTNPTCPKILHSSRWLASGLLTLGLLLASGAASAQGWFDENSIQGYDYQGPYAQFGISVGRVDFDDYRGFNVDSNASGGFHLGGGYRILPWLAADANFVFLGGKDNVEIGSVDGDSQYYAFTFGPKVYPLGAFAPDAIPHFIQPYALIAIGGGAGEVDFSNAPDFDRSFFAARFILGFDVWANDHIGFFMEGGGHVIDQDEVDGIGVFTFGGQYRF